MRKKGDGPQILELFKRPVEKVLRELLGYLRLAGHQHFAFHRYKNPMVTDYLLVMRTDLYRFSWPKSDTVTARIQFPLCCTLTAHFSRKASQFDLYTVSAVPNIVYNIIDKILYDIVYCMVSDAVLGVGCLNNDRSVTIVRLETLGSSSNLERLCMF